MSGKSMIPLVAVEEDDSFSRLQNTPVILEEVAVEDEARYRQQQQEEHSFYLMQWLGQEVAAEENLSR
jgi:hypothetical protein